MRATLAARVTEMIDLPTQRLSAISHVASRWLAADRASAEAWIATLPLTVEEKQRLLSANSNTPAIRLLR